MPSLSTKVFFMVEITRMFWKKAVTSDNFVLGEVQSAELNMENWQVTNLFVGLSEEASQKFGFKHPFLGKVVICLPVEAVHSLEVDHVMLNYTIEELSNLKQCKE
jgi:sporulation protein YlmC with PRC-barrel domain